MTKNNHLGIGGITKLGERGQVVIPAEIRKNMNLENGDQLLVFCKHNHFIGLIKAENLDNMLTDITNQVSVLKKIRKKIKK